MDLTAATIPRDFDANHDYYGGMPEQPWWENLDLGFYRQNDEFELDLKSEIALRSTALADIGLRTLAASLLTASAIPGTFSPLRKKSDRKRSEVYKAMADSGDANLFFKRPEENIEIRHSKSGWYHFSPKDGTSTTLSFDSPFTPVNEDFADSYLKHRRNRVARAQHWRHDGEPRPTICVIHGFMADGYWVNSHFLNLRWFYQQGYDVLLFTLPFHGHRQGRLSPYSGHGYFAGGLSQLSEAVANSVYDFRVFLDYLDSIGVPQYGVTGISLGGYTTAAIASVEDRLAFAIPNIPVVSIIDLLLEWTPANWLTSAMMKFNGLDICEARHRLAAHTPLTYAPKIDRQRLMIIAGTGDRLAPPKHAKLLWNHWGKCAIEWFPGNHVIHLNQKHYLQSMLRFMQQLDFC